MSDPITASIQIALAALKTGAAVATWWETRQAVRSQNPSSDEGRQGYYRQMPEDLLYVMASLGQWMFFLDVVNSAALPAARDATIRAFEAGDPDDNDIGYEFGRMDSAVQFAVTAGMVFCAECWPMHIWKGFGCGVFNELRWADPNHSNIYCLEMDNSIAALKSQPRQWQLLKKSPSAISKVDPETLPRDKSYAKQIVAQVKDVFQQWEKHGFPQPKAPYDYIKINLWWVPFATWNGSSMYENEYHNPNAISMYQSDPGRFLWAWTVGKHADLKPGEAVFLLEDHIQALALWLEESNGMTFRVLRDTEVDFGKIKYSRSTRKELSKTYGNELGISGAAFTMVYDPKREHNRNVAQQITTTFGNVHIGSPTTGKDTTLRNDLPAYSEINSPPVPSGIAVPSKPVTKRRPVPLPTAGAIRMVIATHDFTPESDEELAFSKGDKIEILDDKSDDGWWKARLNNKTGVIPPTFVTDVNPVKSCSLEKPTPYVASGVQATYKSVDISVQSKTLEADCSSVVATKNQNQIHDSRTRASQNTAINQALASVEKDGAKSLHRGEMFTLSRDVGAAPVNSPAPIPDWTPVPNQSMQAETMEDENPPKIIKSPQKKRHYSNLKVIQCKQPKVIWTVDVPVSTTIYQQVSQTKHEFDHIRYSAMTGDSSDLTAYGHSLRSAEQTEILIVIDSKLGSTDGGQLAREVKTTLGSVLDDIRTAPFSSEFENRCDGESWRGIVVCFIVHNDMENDIAFLRQMGMSFYWDIDAVYITDKKRGSAFFDGGRKNPLKLYGKKVETVLQEYTTTFGIKDWQNGNTTIPEITSGCTPTRTISCFCERGMVWVHDADKLIKPIGALLNARMCIKMPGGTRVTPGSIFRQWQMHKDILKPKTSGQDIQILQYQE